jgi:hypothetical protein
MELDKRLRVPVPSVKGLILSVRARMLDNAYHNWSHVVDVTQAAPPKTFRHPYPPQTQSCLIAPPATASFPFKFALVRAINVTQVPRNTAPLQPP